MIYRDAEFSLRNQRWPHQVALPAYRCHGHNYVTIRLFCEPLSLCPRPHPFRGDDADVIVFSFADRKHAEKFRERFGGDFVSPATRPTWPVARTRRTDFSLADYQRNGRCINCVD
jgi:hypothetical protein